MKAGLAKLKAWYHRRDDPAYLARVWAEGQTRYIIHGTLLMGLVWMLMHDYFDGHLRLEPVIIGHLTGAFTAWVGWQDIESRYQSALNQARQKSTVTAPPTNILGLRDS